MNNTIPIETIDEWAKRNAAILIQRTSTILAREGEKKSADLLFAHWWAIFIKNSVALLELLTQANQSYQFNMTMRLLMEMAADVEFMNRYRENVAKQKQKFDKISKKAERLGDMTYEELAKCGRNFHLFRYNSGKISEEVCTHDRIKEAYSEKDVFLYDYLNCFSHFNYLGLMYDLNLSQPGRTADVVKERVRFLQYYPTIFEKEVHAIGDLCDIDELRKYDCRWIYQVFSSLAKNCLYDLAQTEPQ